MHAVSVRAFPRLHFGLIDLGRATARAYGGSGVMLEDPATQVVAYATKRRGSLGIEGVDARAQLEVRAALERLEAFVGRALPVRLKLCTEVLQHVGLGSKTALLLGALQAVCASHNVDVSREALQRLSGRGGTSGVGLHGFFRGGMIVDTGRPQGEVPDLLPSAAGPPASLPYLAATVEVPAEWWFWLIRPEGRRVGGEDEQAFFRRSAPVPRNEVHEALALTFHGLLPAVGSGDLEGVGKALLALQDIGFKRREVQGQSAAVRQLLENLGESNLAAGLSSMGPLVFVVTASDDPPVVLRELLDRTPEAVLGVVKPRNEGFEQRWAPDA